MSATAIAPRRSTETAVGHEATGRRPSARARHDGVNVGNGERFLSTLGGAALAIYGLNRVGRGGLAMGLAGAALIYRGLTGHCQCYAALGVNTADRPGRATSVEAGAGVKVEKSMTIQRSPQDIYQVWRDLEALPRFLSHLESVQDLGGGHSHWVARGPLGTRFEWDAELYNDKPNEMLAWRSLEGSEVDTAGSVHFTPAPGNRGTEVRVVLKYDPPAGRVGAGLARLLGESPEQQIQEDLRRFKQILEAGEAPTTRGQTRCGTR